MRKRCGSVRQYMAYRGLPAGMVPQRDLPDPGDIAYEERDARCHLYWGHEADHFAWIEGDHYLEWSY